MDQAAPQLLIDLEASGLGMAIRLSVWAYPAANVAHVVGVVLFAGAIAVMDLTLLGVVSSSDRTRLIAGARRWAIVFFACVLVAGAVLFIAEASHVALNRVFQVKMALIAFGLANAVWFGGRGVVAATRLPLDAPLPRLARAAALVSLLIWITVAALGRFIAYV